MNLKTIYSLLIILFTFSITYSQEDNNYGFEKGDFYISGAVKYSGLISDQFTPNNELFVEPSVGYFISDNISLGVQSEFLLTNTDNYNIYGVGINGRYFFMPKKRFNVFTELALDYSNAKTSFNTFKDTTEAYSATFSTGLNYFITKNLSLFTKFEILDYSYSQTDIDRSPIFQPQGQQSFDNHRIRIGPENLHLGIMFKF
ncbi:outer membrane beta-barrel protein [Aquimarina sp. MMG016]|uniref:outer membrane beta-barrel protein n=1 Tax=Aquimarina sp. MMG016 TaxID=2822690 RepID=UPI001B3A6700|nr:outer membrane beta-barrel protein [Aquimarina sp. MMG016]MBQ4822292.1 outer membrane beta-barrel protein [Aquimarina sp. MMG016]